MEGELRISKGKKGAYFKWWERLQQSYENRNVYGWTRGTDSKLEQSSFA